MKICLINQNMHIVENIISRLRSKVKPGKNNLINIFTYIKINSSERKYGS